MKRLGLLFMLALMCVALVIPSIAAVDSYTQDFESFAEGTEIVNDKLPGWSLIRPTSEGAFVRVKDGNKYVEITSYYHAEYEKKLTDPYVYEVDVYNSDTGNIPAFFVRAGKERFQVEHGDTKAFEYDGDDKIGFPSVGGSGIFVMPRDGKNLYLVVKTYDESKAFKVGNVMYTVTVNADFSTAFHTLKFVDDGQTVRIYADDELAFMVEMSNSGTYPLGEETYYKKVVVKGKEGNVLGTVENARVSVDSHILIGSRHSKFNIDNIKIYALEEQNTETSDAAFFMPVIIGAMYALVFLTRRQVE
jgi:hypothetical protein